MIYAVLCLVAQSRLTLCDPMDCSPPSSSVHGDSAGKITGVGGHALLQGIFPTQGQNPGLPHCRRILYCLSHQGSPRILEWAAIRFSRGSSRPRDRARVSRIAGRRFNLWATREACLSKSEINQHLCSFSRERKVCDHLNFISFLSNLYNFARHIVHFIHRFFLNKVN